VAEKAEEVERQEARVAMKDPEMDLKLVIVSPHSKCDGTAEVDGASLVIDGKEVVLSHTRGPADIPFTEHGAGYACESTGAAGAEPEEVDGASLAINDKKVALSHTSGPAEIPSQEHGAGYACESTSVAGVEMKYGSIHSRYDGTVAIDVDSLSIDGKKVALSHTRDPVKIPFKEYGADCACESTSVFLPNEEAPPHLKAGAKLQKERPPEKICAEIQRRSEGDMKGTLGSATCPISSTFELQAGIVLDSTFMKHVELPGLLLVMGDALWLLALMVLAAVEVSMRARAAVGGFLARGWAVAAKIDVSQGWSQIRMHGQAAAYLGLHLAVAALAGAIAGGLLHAWAFPAALAPSAAPAALACGWSALNFDATLGYPGEGPGAAGGASGAAAAAGAEYPGPVAAAENAMGTDGPPAVGVAWTLSQQGRGRRAHCCACKAAFTIGEARLQTQGGKRFCHWHCAGTRWRRSATLTGARGVPEDEVERVRALLGEAAAVPEDEPAAFQPEGVPNPLAAAPHGEGGGGDEESLQPPRLARMTWWDNVDVQHALGQRVATMRRVPPGLQSAWAEAMGAALRLSVRGSDPQERERAWKLVMFAPRLIFAATGSRGGRGANGKRAARIQHDLAARLQAFWRGEWQELWDAAHRRELRVAPARGQGGNIINKVRRVRAMLDDGQVAGAVATLRQTGQVATGPGTRDQLRALFPEQNTWNPGQQNAAAALLPEDPREGLSDAIVKAFRKARSGRAPGPDGSRNEYWRVVAADADAAAALSDAALAWVEGTSPPIVDVWLNTGTITALRKPAGGVRPLAVLAPFRRTVLTGFVAYTADATRSAAGPLQYGLGVAGGADVQFRALQSAVHDRPGSLLIAVDVANAFGTVSRQAVLDSLSAVLPEYGSLLARLYAKPAVGLWRDGEGDLHEVSTGSGVPQGCPLSPAAYAAALHRTTLQHFASSPGRLVTAYLDDVVAVVPVAEAEQFLHDLSGRLSAWGLVLNATKTKVWLPRGHTQCPPALRPHVVDDLRVLGCGLTRRQDDDWAELAAGSGGGARAMGKVTEALGVFGQTLDEAVAAGLGVQEAGAMLRWTAQGLPNHLLRAQLVDQRAVQAFDCVLRRLWDRLLNETQTDREWAQACLPLRDGGLAAGAAEPRREAAHVAAWCAAAPAVARALGMGSAEELLARQATGTQGFADAVAAYNTRVGNAAYYLQVSLAQGERSRQKDLMLPVMEVLGARARAGLDDRALGRLLSCGGPGAGAFTLLPTAPEHRMATDLYRLALRRRLQMEGPRLLKGHALQTHCQHTSRDGVVCGALHEPDQHHAIACERGPTRTARHNRVRDLLARWLAKRVPGLVQTEQTVPQWTRRRRDPETGQDRMELAVLDVKWSEKGVCHVVDVVVTSPDSADEREERARAAHAGLAAEDAARGKQLRYPPGPTTPALTPFAVETGGRVGQAARQLVLDRLDHAEGEAGASADATAFWQELSATLQTAVAEQILAAH
ncbi:unnamed protein product, partial [Prorocentrum cordatum]